MEDRYRFRFWLENKKKWFYFGFETFHTYKNQIERALADGEKIYQCTGLKDKNGKLIYEFDLIRDLTYSCNAIFICAYVPIFGSLGLLSIQDWKDYNHCKENWKYYHSNDEVKRLDNRFKLANQGNKLNCFRMDELILDKYEIIGNIFENKDLLEDKKYEEHKN